VAADVAGSGAQPPAIPSAQPRLRERSQARELAISLIWLAGAAALLARNIVANLRLAAIRRRLLPITSPALRELLDGARAELRVRRRIQLLTSDAMPAPALIGLWRPAIVLPRHVLARMSRPELRLVLLHELAHVRRYDLLINWITALLSAVHWFNPIVWVVVARMRTDRELACDEMVLARAGKSAGAGDPRAAYGGVLVKLIESIAATAAQPAARCPLRRQPRAGTAILENAHQLRRRVTWIANFAPRPRAWSALALAAALVLCLTFMTAPVTAQYERAMRQFLAPLARPSVVEAAGAAGEPFQIVISCPITALSNYLAANPELRDRLNALAPPAPAPAMQPGAPTATPLAIGPSSRPSGDAVAEARSVEVLEGWMLEDPDGRDASVVIAEPVWEPGAVRIPNPTVGTSVERLARSVARRRKQAEAEAQVIIDQIATFRGAHPNILHEEAVSKEVATVSQALLEARLQLIDARATYGEHHDRTKAAQAKHDELARLSEQTIKRSAEMNTTTAEYQKLTTALSQKQDLIRRLDDRAASLEEMGQIIEGLRGEERGPATNPLGQEASPLPPRLIVVDEKIAAANDATARVLEQPVAELLFDRTPMKDVIDRFGRLAPGTNVYVDWNGLMTCGVDRDFPVSIYLRNVPLGVALAQTLRAAQDQTGMTARTRLTYLIDHGNVSVTTDEEADKILFTRTYDVSDLARDAQSLERVTGLVRQSVRSNVWRENGGSGEIGGFGGKLVVTVNDTTHREIGKLLAGLRAGNSTRADR
jgi:beta-lactamase regulating signal transducer with metallopeptidase domain